MYAREFAKLQIHWNYSRNSRCSLKHIPSIEHTDFRQKYDHCTAARTVQGTPRCRLLVEEFRVAFSSHSTALWQDYCISGTVSTKRCYISLQNIAVCVEVKPDRLFALCWLWTAVIWGFRETPSVTFSAFAKQPFGTVASTLLSGFDRVWSAPKIFMSSVSFCFILYYTPRLAFNGISFNIFIQKEFDSAM